MMDVLYFYSDFEFVNMIKVRDIFIDYKYFYVKCYFLIILIFVIRCDLYRNYVFLNNDFDFN